MAFVASKKGGVEYLAPSIELVKHYLGVCFESVKEKVAEAEAEAAEKEKRSLIEEQSKKVVNEGGEGDADNKV